MQHLATGPIWYLVFLFSIVCHEAAHAFAAKSGGDLTAYEQGQVTLNPLPHIQREFWGTVIVPWLTFFLSGFMMGWASAPYDPYWEIRYPRRAALMSLAGPLANLALVILSGLALKIGLSAGAFSITYISFSHIVSPVDPIWSGLALMLSIMFSLNLLLFVFNLIPLPPLDGMTVATLFLNEEWALKVFQLSRHPASNFFGFLVAWQIFPLVAQPIFAYALKFLI